MAEVKSLACDVCRGQPAATWLLGEVGDKQWHVDLCLEHSLPMRQMVQIARPAGTKPGRHRFRKTVQVRYRPEGP